MREGVAPRPAPAGAWSAALSVSAVRYSTTPTSLSHEGTWDDVKVAAPLSHEGTWDDVKVAAPLIERVAADRLRLH